MMMKTQHTLLLSLLASGSLYSLSANAAPDELTIDTTPQQQYYSSDGQILYYYFTDAGGFANFVTLNNGVPSLVFVGDLPGGNDDADVRGIAPDGSLAAGTSEGGLGFYQPYYWTPGTGIMAIPAFAGSTGEGRATAVSKDGTTVVGQMHNAFGAQESFYWTQAGGTVNLGMPAGWTLHEAYDVSDDGSAITGSGFLLGNFSAYHWTQGTGLVAIPLLPPGVNPSSYNQASAISGDGNFVVGYNEYMFTGGEAFIWSQGTGSIGMGFLGADTLSSGTYVNYDGSQAYGYSFGGGPVAFRWTQATGPVSMNQIMIDAGIDMTGINIDYVYSASDDGLYVSGMATGLGTNFFIANLNSSNPGIVTPTAVAESIGSMPELRKQGTQKTIMQMGQSLFAARLHPIMQPVTTPVLAASIPASPADIAPAAGGNSSSFLAVPPKISGFIVGSLVGGQSNDLDNWGVNGLAGFKFALSDDFSVGVGISGSATRTNGIFDSHTDIVSKGASLLASYEPSDSGLRLYASIFGAKLDIDTYRGYDAGAVDYSSGETEGQAMGAAARIGWETKVSDSVALQPFLEGHVTHVTVDGYTENGGSFPATFSEQSETTTLGKIGLETRYQFSPTLSLSGQLAYVRSSNNSDTGVTTSVSGLTFSTEGESGDTSWGEMTLGAQWALGEDTQLNAEINARSGDTQAPQVNATVGLTYNF